MWKAFAAIMLLLPVPVQALTIQGSPRNVETIEKATDLLSNCEMEAALKGGLKTISVVKHGGLGVKEVEGEVYIAQAYSFFRSGNVYIDVYWAKNPVVTIHEMYHWIYRSLVYHDYDAAWGMAVNLDYSQQTKKQQNRDIYLKDREEAWAELGAYRELGEHYFDHSKYWVNAYPHANALMAEIMEKSCGQSVSQ